MMKRRFVSTFFAAVSTIAASAVSLAPVDNSSTFYMEGSSGEQVFVGEADSASFNIVLDNSETALDNRLLVSGTDTTKLTDQVFKIGTNKCYSILYTYKDTYDQQKSGTTYLSYIKKTAVAPKVSVCDYDSLLNPVCDPEMKVKFSNLDYTNSYVDKRGETVKIKDNLVLTYLDYEADGVNVKDKAMEVVVNGLNNDSTLSIQKPKRHTVFKLKDKMTQYEYITDTFRSLLPFSAAQITIDAEAIPHNREKRNDEAVTFGTLEDAKRNLGNYLFSGPLYINLERNSVDNVPADTIDATYTWRFFNDSTATLRNSYRVRYNDLTLDNEHIDEYGTHFVMLAIDNSACKDTLIAGFKVRTSELMMPSVFTPNGDGTNDEFRPTYTSIVEYRIWIYNTMGKKMYDSEDITVGWDGTHKGKDAPIGAYYYVVEAKGVDGVNYKLKGTVNLVRNAEN